jgi:hypothetical protein
LYLDVDSVVWGGGLGGNGRFGEHT